MEKLFTSYRKKIINRVEHNTLASNLVYPYEKGYHMVMKCDKKFVETRLRREFNLNKVNTDVIQNKYVIRSNFMGRDMLVYNHNGSYYLIEEDEEVLRVYEKLKNITDKF